MPEISTEYSPAKYQDATLEHVLEGKKHAHSQFRDVNGKNHTFEGCDFSYCVFERAYFHNATFSHCKFIGSYFIDCNFRHAQIRGCDFSYATISGTRLPTQEILNNLPTYPNVQREFLQTLRRNAMSLGDYAAEKIFVVHEIDSKKEHYRNVWKRKAGYYRDKYSFLQSIGYGFKYLGLVLDGLIWGHGERLWKAPIALAVLIVCVSMFLTFDIVSNLPEPTLTAALDTFLITLSYHLNLFLDLPTNDGVKGVQWINWLLVIVRYVALGVLVSALYRRLSHR